MEARNSYKAIIGLGNPDKKYYDTYHNVGFLFIDFLKNNRDSFEISTPNTKISKSDVFMNESGKYVKKNAKKYGAKPIDLLIVHDDSDIYLGDYKLSFDKNSAGHKGIDSIITNLKSKKFWRLRIGIRPKEREGQERLKAEKFVLKKISASNKKAIESAFSKIANNL